jgi:hypothetical protein
MNKMKIFAGILLFGSLWGFSESIIGSALSEVGLPAGAIMTGFFALTFLVISRMTYKQPGMQLGMSVIAGTLRLFNPFASCHICSALAIMAEGAIFELIWYNISFDFKELKSITMQVSMGILTSYIIYVGGYILTQILTPIVSGPGFYFENLIAMFPNILSSGLLPAIIGGVILPATVLIKKVDFTIKDRLYYPTTIGISLLCWSIVIGSWFFIGT